MEKTPQSTESKLFQKSDQKAVSSVNKIQNKMLSYFLISDYCSILGRL